jgi:hypothetical protein
MSQKSLFVRQSDNQEGSHFWQNILVDLNELVRLDYLSGSPTRVRYNAPTQQSYLTTYLVLVHMSELYKRYLP